MANNVVRFDPKKRRRKRPLPTAPNAQLKRPTSRKQPRWKSIILMGLSASAIIGLVVFSISSCSSLTPGTSLTQLPATSPSTDNGKHPPAASSSRIIGVASVIDGDTIEIHGDRIRLDGYDAPERGSMCGQVNVYQKASLALSDLVGRKTVTCETSGKDRYGRFIATCQVQGQGFAEYMVEEGWARDWPKYSGGAYADQERNARVSRRGIWGLECSSDLWGNRNYN